MTDESTIYLFSLTLLSMFFQKNQANLRHRHRIRRQLLQILLITSETGTKAKAMSPFTLKWNHLSSRYFRNPKL